MATAGIAVAAAPHVAGKAARFYRPELDALRLFAFLAVYLCHSVPNALIEDLTNAGDPQAANTLAAIKDAGNFGVCLFFLLSAFLITELLRREERTYGSIHAGAFYLRRILRIWPLYFGVTLLYVLGGHFFHAMRLEPGRVAAYFLLAGNWYIALHPWIQTPLRSLWSISVEEQFYLAWPLLARYGGMGRLLQVSLAIIPLALLTAYIVAADSAYTYNTVWLNSFAQFQFFAYGALLALMLKGRVPQRHSIPRMVMAACGVFFWLLAAGATKIKRPGAHISSLQCCFGYLLVAAGCLLIFRAVLGVSSKCVPQWIAYLGKISFGLYVFHETAFLLVDELQKHIWNFSQNWVVSLAINKTFALCLTILLAIFSYHVWETPFLQLKRRFTWIHSREI